MSKSLETDKVLPPDVRHLKFFAILYMLYMSTLLFFCFFHELVEELSLDQAPGKWKLHRKGHGGHTPSEIFILKNNNLCNWQTSSFKEIPNV